MRRLGDAGIIKPFLLESNNRIGNVIHQFPVLIKFSKNINKLHCAYTLGSTAYDLNGDLKIDYINAHIDRKHPTIVFTIPILDMSSELENYEFLELPHLKLVEYKYLQNRNIYFFNLFQRVQNVDLYGRIQYQIDLDNKFVNYLPISMSYSDDSLSHVDTIEMKSINGFEYLNFNCFQKRLPDSLWNKFVDCFDNEFTMFEQSIELRYNSIRNNDLFYFQDLVFKFADSYGFNQKEMVEVILSLTEKYGSNNTCLINEAILPQTKEDALKIYQDVIKVNIKANHIRYNDENI